MASSSYDISGLAVGIVTIIPGLYALLCYNLPSRRFKVLKKDFNETFELFEKVTEEGLLPQQEFVQEVGQNLNTCRCRMEHYREKVYRASGFMQQFQELCEGLSRKINATCDQVRKIRTDIVSKSNKERERLQEVQRSHSLTNPFGASGVPELGAYSQIIDYDVPARPSPIYSDVAIPLLRSVRRHSTQVSSLLGEQHSSTDELFLGQATDPNILFADPASVLPVPNTPPASNTKRRSPAGPATNAALTIKQSVDSDPTIPDPTIFDVATTDHADRPILLDTRQHCPSQSDASKLSQLAILHQNLLSAAQAISLLHSEMSLSSS